MKDREEPRSLAASQRTWLKHILQLIRNHKTLSTSLALAAVYGLTALKFRGSRAEMRPSPRRLLLKGLLRLNTSTSVYIASHISSHRSQFYAAAVVVVVGMMKYWQHVRNMVRHLARRPDDDVLEDYPAEGAQVAERELEDAIALRRRSHVNVAEERDVRGDEPPPSDEESDIESNVELGLDLEAERPQKSDSGAGEYRSPPRRIGRSLSWDALDAPIAERLYTAPLQRLSEVGGDRSTPLTPKGRRELAMRRALRFLQQLHHISALAPEAFADLYERLEVCSFSPGELVFAQGSESFDGMYIVLSGSLGIFSRPQGRGRRASDDDWASEASVPPTPLLRSAYASPATHHDGVPTHEGFAPPFPPLPPSAGRRGRPLGGSRSSDDDESEAGSGRASTLSGTARRTASFEGPTASRPNVSSPASAGGHRSASPPSSPSPLGSERGGDDESPSMEEGGLPPTHNAAAAAVAAQGGSGNSTPHTQAVRRARLVPLGAGETAPPAAGEAKEHVTGPQLLCAFGRAATIGENAVLSGEGHRRPVTCRAIRRTRALRLNRELFQWFVQRHLHSVIAFVLTTTARQWRVAHFLLVEFLALPGHHALSMGPGRGQPCLAASELTHIREVANARGVVRTMQTGDVLFAAGEPADAVCIVLEGSVSCYDAATTRVQRVGDSGTRSRQQDAASRPRSADAAAAQGAGHAARSVTGDGPFPPRRPAAQYSRLAQDTPESDRQAVEDSDTGRTGSPRSLLGPGLLVQDRHNTSALGLAPESALSSSGRRSRGGEHENHVTARVRRSRPGSGAAEGEGAHPWWPPSSSSSSPRGPSPPTLELAVPESGEGVAHCCTGCVVGGIAAVTGTQHRESAVCLHPDTKVAVLPIALLHELAEREAQQHLSEGGATSVLSLVQGVVRHMCPLLDAFLGAGLQRVWRKAGQILYAQDDAANSLYVVISGRVRAIMQRATPLGAFPRRARQHLRHTSSREQPSTAAAAAAHYADDVILSGGVDVGRGESIGELSLLSSSRKRFFTAVCVRDCELVRISRPAWETIVRRHPSVLERFVQVMANRLRFLTQRSTAATPLIHPVEVPLARRRPQARVVTVAVVRAGSQRVPGCPPHRGTPSGGGLQMPAGDGASRRDQAARLAAKSLLRMGETTIRGVGVARDAFLSALRSATRGAGLRLDGPAWKPDQKGTPCDETLPEVMSTGAFCRRLSSCLRRVAQEEALDEGRAPSRRQGGQGQREDRGATGDRPGTGTGAGASATGEGSPHVENPLCTLLTSASVRRAFGGDLEGRMHEYFVRARVSAWLGEQEERSRFVVLQTDEACTPWTQLCVRQADVVLLVGDGTFGGPSMSDVESRVVFSTTKRTPARAKRAVPTRPPPRTGATTGAGAAPVGSAEAAQASEMRAQAARLSKLLTRKELVLLHSHNVCPPRGTRFWLRARDGVGGVTRHHHVRCAPREDAEGDMMRLARHLSGRAVGAVLGGGGARGLAHIGALRRMSHYRLPVDCIGGTSQGACIGAMYAMTADVASTEEICDRLVAFMGDPFSLLSDFTLPLVSYFSGEKMNELLQNLYGDTQIEDTWIPFFCISTNVTDAKMMVHETGPLWRYVRASMTVIGMLPPLLDRGQLLVDGGYVNNLPVDVMRALGAHTVVCVDVEDKDNSSVARVENYGDSLSGWWLLWKWLLSLARLGPPARIPSLADTNLSVAYISHYSALRRVLAEGQRSHTIVYLRPSVQGYKLLDYGRAEDLYRAGEVSTEEQLVPWLREIKRLRRDRARRRAAADAAGQGLGRHGTSARHGAAQFVAGKYASSLRLVRASSFSGYVPAKKPKAGGPQLWSNFMDAGAYQDTRYDVDGSVNVGDGGEDDAHTDADEDADVGTVGAAGLPPRRSVSETISRS